MARYFISKDFEPVEANGHKDAARQFIETHNPIDEFSSLDELLNVSTGSKLETRFGIRSFAYAIRNQAGRITNQGLISVVEIKI